MPEPRFPRPLVVVSKCLGFEACRWNQAVINDEFVERLGQWVDYRPICPEVEAGLGVPRDPIRLVDQGEGIRVVQPATDKDWTAPLVDRAKDFLGSLNHVEGFLLKSRSPSCGPGEVKIYSGTQRGAASRKGSGIFASLAREGFPQAALEHEGRVKNFQLREHFLTKLFTLAHFREVINAGTMGRLVEFQSTHKLLLMAYNQNRMRIMGRLTANPDHLPLDQVLASYNEQLALALARAPKFTANINVLMHALGYFKKDLSHKEKAHFLDTIELYRQGRVLLNTLQALLQSWILRHDREYLAGQSFFQPYPLDLLDLADSGKGR